MPHIQPEEATFFVTTRLWGSLPTAIIKQLKTEHDLRLESIERLETDPTAKGRALSDAQKRYFTQFDNQLDRPKNGPYWLAESAIAEITVKAIHFLHGKDYHLIAFCVMSNHIHLVIDTHELAKSPRPLYKIMQTLKRHIAGKGNEFLHRTGAFWQDESYDHVVRNPQELKNIIAYTLNNPVKAGLVDTWEEWPYSYANEDFL